MTLDEEVDSRGHQDHRTDGTEDLAAGGSSVQRIWIWVNPPEMVSEWETHQWRTQKNG